MCGFLSGRPGKANRGGAGLSKPPHTRVGPPHKSEKLTRQQPRRFSAARTLSRQLPSPVARVLERAADDLLHFALVDVDARPETHSPGRATGVCDGAESREGGRPARRVTRSAGQYTSCPQLDTPAPPAAQRTRNWTRLVRGPAHDGHACETVNPMVSSARARAWGCGQVEHKMADENRAHCACASGHERSHVVQDIRRRAASGE